MSMTEKKHRKVALGSPIFPDRPPLPPEEIARRKAEDEKFGRRCREIFQRVYPELVKEHYNWFILIEPDSGDFFIDPDEKVASRKGHEKYPKAVMLMMRLNETGTCGRI